METGNYSEFLPICDYYELLLRTAIKTKMAKIHQLAYVQYMNDNGNNFSFIRNAEINRLTPYHIRPQCFHDYKINDIMKELDGYEGEEYSYNHSQVWKRKNYTYKYINKLINLHYEKTYCIIGYEKLLNNIERIKELYNNEKNDFLILDNKITVDQLCNYLDNNNFDRMKCYAMNDCSEEELINYFHHIYKSTEHYEIIS
jgi:GH18 family chitinase